MLKPVKFRIQNYKSIIDSRDCYLSEKVTILAGRTESGKTAILEALEDFDPGNTIRQTAVPLQRPDAAPTITVTFDVDPKTLQTMLTTLGGPSSPKSNVHIKVIKKYPAQYEVSEDSLVELRKNGLPSIDDLQESTKQIYSDIYTTHSKFPGMGGTLPNEIDFENLKDFSSNFQNFNNQAMANISEITDKADRSQFSKLMEAFTIKLKQIEKLAAMPETMVQEVKTRLPQFILFSSFDDTFPSEIPLTEVANDSLTENLAATSSLDLSLVTSGTAADKTRHKTRLNKKLKERYKQFWSQDDTNLEIDWDSTNLMFFVSDDDHFYTPEQRSKGKQWHLSFFIKVSASVNDGKPKVILIDEPGQYLHPKAQNDVLNMLERTSEQVPIIFSTHSPYLIDPSKLNRVRLVLKDQSSGTVVEGKIHKVSDKEALTPILTAMGAELTSGITNLDKLNNTVIEGPSDLYYLQAFRKVAADYDINFVFGGGSGNMPVVGAILTGWGCHVLYLFDNDQGGRDGKKNLKDNWYVSGEGSLIVSDVAGASLEDLFSKNDFKKFVLGKEELKYESANSSHLKKSRKDKVLLAKQFLERMDKESVALSEETLGNIRCLFEQLKQRFETVFGSS